AAARTAAAVRTPATNANAPSALGSTPPPTLRPAGRAATPTAEAATRAYDGVARLTASPNPVIFKPEQVNGVESSTIAWSTGRPDVGQIWVSMDGKPEKLFVEGPEGTADANWIRPGSTYDFRLYAGEDHSQQLASLTGKVNVEIASSPRQQTVAAAAPVPTVAPVAEPVSLEAEPNPVPADDEELGTTTIKWSVGTQGNGQVWVSEDGGPEKLFSSGARGSQDADWICRNREYEFHLYNGTAHTQLLEPITFTRAEDEPGHEPPPNVLCEP